MKTDKNKFKENLLEGIFELVFTAIFFGIGAIIIYFAGSLFGFKIDLSDMDLDTVVFIGIVTPIVVFLIISYLTQSIKEKIKEKRK